MTKISKLFFTWNEKGWLLKHSIDETLDENLDETYHFTLMVKEKFFWLMVPRREKDKRIVPFCWKTQGNVPDKQEVPFLY